MLVSLLYKHSSGAVSRTFHQSVHVIWLKPNYDIVKYIPHTPLDTIEQYFDEDIECVYIESSKDQIHSSIIIITRVTYRPPNRYIASFNDKLCITLVERMKKEN